MGALAGSGADPLTVRCGGMVEAGGTPALPRKANVTFRFGFLLVEQGTNRHSSYLPEMNLGQPGSRGEEDTMSVWGNEQVIIDMVAGRVAVRGPVEFVREIDWPPDDQRVPRP